MKSSVEYNNEGILSEMNGQPGEAMDMFYTAIETDPQNDGAHNNLGFLLMQQGLLTEAIEHFDAALAINPDNDIAHLNKGNAHLVKEEMKLAYTHYTKALELNRENVLAWEMLAKFFILVNQPEEVAKAWTQAVQLDPGEIWYRLELAIALSALGKYDDAMALLEIVLQQEYNNARAFRQMGIIYLVRKDYSMAEELLNKAKGLAPGDEVARYHLSLVYLATGAYTEAEKELRRLVQLNPQNTKARNDLAVLLVSRGELENALTELNESLQADPDNSRAKYYKAIALHQRNCMVEAEAILIELTETAYTDYNVEAKLYLKKYFNY